MNGQIINLHFTANLCVFAHINWKLTIDFVLSGRLAIGGAISSSSEFRGECVWFKLCMPWLFCIEIDVGIVWLLWMGCSTTWPTCECVSLSVGVLLGLELLTRLNEEPIDEARREFVIHVKYYSRVLNLYKVRQQTTVRNSITIEEELYEYGYVRCAVRSLISPLSFSSFFFFCQPGEPYSDSIFAYEHTQFTTSLRVFARASDVKNR